MGINLFIILVILDLIISEDSNEEQFNKFNNVFYLWKLMQSFKNQLKEIILYLFNMVYKWWINFWKTIIISILLLQRLYYITLN